MERDEGEPRLVYLIVTRFIYLTVIYLMQNKKSIKFMKTEKANKH